MKISVKASAIPSLGNRIRELRQERGFTQDALAKPQYTKGYVSALERGAVRPSLKALEIFAQRLGVSITDILTISQVNDDKNANRAQKEDFLTRCNYARSLIRAGNLDEALRFIDNLEGQIQPYAQKLPPNLACRLPLLRGELNLWAGDLAVARAALETALEIAMPDEEAAARVRNLLGVTLLKLDLPQLAMEQHLTCLNTIREGAILDRDFSVSVCRNLAGDYGALSEPAMAVEVYEYALPLLENPYNLHQQAAVSWELAAAHEAANDPAQGRMYGLRALYINEIADSLTDAADVCLNLAETRISEQQYAVALELLKRAEHLLASTGNRALMSYLYREYADLARRQGQHERASQNASESTALARAYYEDTATQPAAGWAGQLSMQDPTRLYVEALHLEALIEEDGASREAADRLFEKALALLHPHGFEDKRHSINLSYAMVLEARGELEKATTYYRAAAQLQPHIRWRRT